MTRGKKTGGRDFQPGQSGNPNGRPKLTLEQREFRNATKKEVIDEIKYLWSLSIEDLQKVAGRFVFKKANTDESHEVDEKEWVHVPGEDPNVPLLRLALAKALLKSAQNGDMHQLNQILDRVIGKVKDEIDHNIKGSIHAQIVDIINKVEGGNNGDKENTEEDDQA